MPEITTDQAVIIENCFTKLDELLDPATVPEDVAKMLLEAKQILAGIIEGAQESNIAQSSGYGDQGGPK